MALYVRQFVFASRVKHLAWHLFRRLPHLHCARLLVLGTVACGWQEFFSIVQVHLDIHCAGTLFLRPSHRAIATGGSSFVVATVTACHGVAGVGASHVGPSEDVPWEQAHGRYESGATEEVGSGPCGTDGW